jgi:hypothetical protein
VPLTVTDASVPQVLPSELQSDEESHVAETLASEHSDEIEDFEDFHVVGDIIHVCRFLCFPLPHWAHTPLTILILCTQLIPTFAPETRQISFLNVSGVAVRSNKAEGFFDVDAAQYTTNYKSDRHLSVLPVRATFNSNKYKNKKPIPSNNTYVSVEGTLYDFETDTNGQATRFWLSVDNISFLGRASSLPSSSASPPGRGGQPFFFSFFSLHDLTLLSLHPFTGTASTPSPSRRFKYSFEMPDLSPSSPPTSPPSEFEIRTAAATPATPTALPLPGPSTRAGKRKK